MDYFMMHQDKRIYYKPQIKLPDKSRMKNQISHSTVAMIMYVEANKYNEYSGYIETPVKLITKKIKPILNKYQPDIMFKPVILIEKESNRQEEYYKIDIPPAECASKHSVYDALGNITEFILDEEKVKHLRIFSVKDYKNQICVRLDVAESILRRNAYGIMFEKVKKMKRGDQDE